ncbi:hypothetical protein LTR22_028287 [Elasticomyces elasticus]|nr:hypothetical protein LTR22_028287 [Elasticomyces elasticus]
MRLLRVESLDFAEFRDDNRPPYIFEIGRNTNGQGYQKVEAFAKYIRRNLQPVSWLWIDTCCINRDSAAELSEAVNSMFEWYRHAQLCLAYLADVETADDKDSFEKSEWFKRGWTLQELLAPRLVLFVTKKWHVIGHKGHAAYGDCQSSVGLSLQKSIAQVTKIPEKVLHNYEASTHYTPQDKV